jgi:uncharacterized repeat protein (TIGR03847 family)
MSDETEQVLDPVGFILVDAEGPPGHRTFYLQAGAPGRLVTLIIEKEQAFALASSIDRLMLSVLRGDPSLSESLSGDLPEPTFVTPSDPAFRVAEMQLGVDEDRRVFILVAREVPEDLGPGPTVRVVASYRQMVALARRATRVALAGRPVCRLCGRPMDPDGHFCTRSNGHATLPT